MKKITHAKQSECKVILPIKRKGEYSPLRQVAKIYVVPMNMGLAGLRSTQLVPTASISASTWPWRSYPWIKQNFGEINWKPTSFIRETNATSLLKNTFKKNVH